MISLMFFFFFYLKVYKNYGNVMFHIIVIYIQNVVNKFIIKNKEMSINEIMYNSKLQICLNCVEVSR